MTFATSKLGNLLPAATFAVFAEVVMDLARFIICGQILGETGLAALNLMQGIFEVVAFVALLVSIGTGVLFSTEIGASHIRRAKGYFTFGAITAILSGVLLTAILALVRLPVIASFSPPEAVYKATAEFWLWYLPAAALQPIVLYLVTMCYVDGNPKSSVWSYLIQILGSVALSIPLTMSLGIKGCAIAQTLGLIGGLAVLSFHFFRAGCQLRISTHFRISDLVRIIQTSFGDASLTIGKAILLFVLNAYVISHFGSESLPVLAVVVMTIALTEVFGGVGNAIQPLVSVYVGERNTLLTRRVVNAAIKVVLLEGFVVATFLIIYPHALLKLAGLNDPLLIPSAITAVRLVSISYVGLALVQLFNSYYVFIQREMLAATLSLLAMCVSPVALCYLLGPIWGENGVWLALGIGSFVALAIIAIYLWIRCGACNFPLLLPREREANLRVIDLVLEPSEICTASQAVQSHLESHKISPERAVKAALLVEEALMVVRERNAGKRILAEITIDLNDDAVVLVLRDDGVIFDLTDADAQISSLRTYLVSNLMVKIPYRRNLTTIGFNRNIFRI